MAEAARKQRRPKKPDLQRTLKQVVESGLTVGRIEVDRDGKQVIHMAGASGNEDAEDVNSIVL